MSVSNQTDHRQLRAWRQRLHEMRARPSDRFRQIDRDLEWQESYWHGTRHPLLNLFFIAPILAAYEGGVAWLSGSSGAEIRTGVDGWVHQGLARFNVHGAWILPVMVVAALLIWQVAGGFPLELRWRRLAGMVIESLVLGIALIGLGQLADHLAFGPQAQPELQVCDPGVLQRTLAPFVGFLGAGVYEEAVFRLALIPIAYGLLRLFHMSDTWAGTMAITGSALLFTLAHHVGPYADGFDWYVFGFRWMAGVYFAGVFLLRGFGIAVGCHTAYDMLVGWIALNAASPGS